jgi:hypothetical protein
MSKESKPEKPKPEQNPSVLPPESIFGGAYQKKDSGQKFEKRDQEQVPRSKDEE